MNNDNLNIDNNLDKDNKTHLNKFWKFKFIFGILIFGFLAVLVKLFIVQVLNADKYKVLARKQHEYRDSLNPERGKIYDRNGRLLASSYHSLSFAVDPKTMKNPETRAKLASLFQKHIKDRKSVV